MIEILICYCLGSMLIGFSGWLKQLLNREDPRHTESQQFLRDYEMRLMRLTTEVDRLRERAAGRDVPVRPEERWADGAAPTGPSPDGIDMYIEAKQRVLKRMRNKEQMKDQIEQRIDIHIGY